MKNFINKEKLNYLLKKMYSNLKERYLYMIVFTIALLAIPLMYKGLRYVELKGPIESSTILQSGVIEQDVSMNFDRPIKISMRVGKNNPTEDNKYEVSILDKDNTIAQAEVNVKELKDEQLIVMMLPRINDMQGKTLKVRIEGKSNNENNGLKIYSYLNDDNNLSINNVKSNTSMIMSIAYNRFSPQYIMFMVMIFVVGNLLLLIIDVRKIANSIFMVIMLLGTFVIMLNPILDTPDDHTHLARTELTSRGILFVNGASEYKISSSTKDIIKHNYQNLINVNLVDINSNYDVEWRNYASSNSFVGYIPQTIGMIVAKLLFNNSKWIVVLGRVFNLLAYALMVRYALKKTPIFKVPLSIIAIMPMSLFIAASFNPDATTYGLSFITIAYLLYLYDKGNINIKEILITSVLCIILGFVKLPYCMLAGILIFFPKSKYIDNKTYYKSFLFVGLVAIISLSIGLKAMFGGGSNSSAYSGFYEENNINSSEQIKYIISNPILFIRNFLMALLDNLRMYLDQLSTFGWLSYSVSGGISTIYPIFIGSVMLLYPNKKVLDKKTKYGFMLVAFAVYAVTNLIMYISWTPVGSGGIDGVQGRYFIPVFAMLMLLSNGKKEEDNSSELDYKIIFVSIIFVTFLLTFMLNRYY